MGVANYLCSENEKKLPNMKFDANFKIIYIYNAVSTPPNALSGSDAYLGRAVFGVTSGGRPPSICCIESKEVTW